jgi:hypothetical protein
MSLFRSTILFAAAVTLLRAQNPTGQITGRVLDAAQAAIPQAAIQATNLATNVVARGQSNAEGLFDIRGLAPGAYRVEVTRDGFKRYSQEPVAVRVGDVIALEIPLEIGAVTENVTVRAEAPMLESANAGMGQVVENRNIEELPTPGNSVLYMLQTIPGTGVNTSPTNLWPPDALGSASSTSVAGVSNASEFAIDGNPMMTRGGGFSFNPSPEMIQEFRVQVATYDASLGHFTGGHLNMVTKGGTNTQHGSFVYSNLSRGFMAHDFFTNRYIYDTRTGPITSEKIDQAWPPQRVIRYRGNTGGPLVIPKLYNGRNRTFWIFSGDGVIRQRASRNSYTVPTPKMREGDFSELLAIGSSYQIYDPATTRPSTPGRYSRQPFPGNIVPASRIDPAAKQLIGYYPLPNTPGNRDGSSNYTDPNLADSPYVGFLGRVDHAVNDNHRLFLSLYLANGDPVSDQYFHNIATGTVRTRVQEGIALNDAVVITPAWIAELRYGLTRFSDPTHPPSLGYDLSTLGISSSLIAQLDRSLTTLPATSISGLTSIGGNSGSNPNTTYHTFSAQFTHPVRSHSLRLGGEYRLMRESVYSYGNVAPAYSFGSTWTVGPNDNSASAPTGQGLASLFLGLPTGGSIQRQASSAESSGYFAGYLQDDWKITRRLTLNIGVRYELETATTERYNRTSRGFDFVTPNPIEAAARAAYAKNPIPQIAVNDFHTTGGLLFAGVNGVPTRYYDADRNNFAPRIGFAYRVLPQTVVRGGYAIYYAPLGSDRVDAIQQGFSRTTALVASVDSGQTFQASLRDPFPNGILAPVGAADGLKTFLGQGITYLAPNRVNPYVQRWSFNLQREMPARVLIDLGYIGSRGVKLSTTQDLNAVPAQYLSTSPVRDSAVINLLTQTVSNPFFGMAEFGGSSIQGQTVARSQLLRPYPQFASLSTVTGAGSSWYHALALRVEKRLSQGFSLQGSYTYSKTMEAVEYLNPSDMAPTHSVSSLDRTHSLSITGIYDLPVGLRRRWLNHSRLIDLAVGGWSVQGIYQGSSGLPLSFGNAAFYGDIKDIALPNSERTADRWFNTEAGFEKSAGRQLANNIRTFPLRLNGVRSDGFNILNLSAYKNFRITERLRLQFRAEAVDALNHPIFSAPNTSPTSGSFGQVTSLGSGNTQRRITFTGKVTW